MVNKNFPEIEERLLGAYVGAKNREYYFNKWAKSAQSWNWAAFFLSFLWLGYRKMYSYIFMVVGIFLLYDLIIVFSGFEFGMDSTIGITLSVICGLLGNYLYLMHANKEIKKVTEQNSRSMENIQAELEKRGGTSWLGVLVAFGMIIMYIILAAFIYGV